MLNEVMLLLLKIGYKIKLFFIILKEFLVDVLNLNNFEIFLQYMERNETSIDIEVNEFTVFLVILYIMKNELVVFELVLLITKDLLEVHSVHIVHALLRLIVDLLIYNKVNLSTYAVIIAQHQQ